MSAPRRFSKSSPYGPYRSREDYCRSKDARRARLWTQGCTDDGQPLSDPAYYAQFARQESVQ